jgi:hypothetical protein
MQAWTGYGGARGHFALIPPSDWRHGKAVPAAIGKFHKIASYRYYDAGVISRWGQARPPRK